MGSVYCSLGGDQCKNLYSRNSQGIYYVRGDKNGMRLEKAIIKGAVVVSPFGYETEHLTTITKQVSECCNSLENTYIVLGMF